jgi:large conductance mechanosensitive channel
MKHSEKVWKEFKEFVIKGNALDLAVGVISLLTGGLDFSNKFVVLRAPPSGGTFATAADAVKAGAITWNYGNFVTLIINFAIVAFAVFLLVRGINKMKEPTQEAPVSKDCPACAMTIPVKATRCPHCTTDLSRPSATQP